MVNRHTAIESITSLTQEEFVLRFGYLFEGSPWIAAQTWEARPFDSVDHLHEALCATMHSAPVERQEALIKAHPDLVGRAALAGTLTPESTHEQASAGLDRLSPEEVETFTRLNAAYRGKFGFPFVICARDNKKSSILAGFKTRLNNSREQEINTALGEISRIAYLRLLDAVPE